MANGYYKALYKAYSQWKKDENYGSKSTSSNVKSVKSKVSSAKKKLSSQGIDTDTRSFVEKTLGLPDDQNIVFDFFELLGRPQQALFGAIDASMSGGDAKEAALEHLKGNKKTYMKDLLMYNDTVAASDRKGKIDYVDVVGTLGDIILDPVDLIPVAGFGKFGDALKAGDNVIDASKALKTPSDLAMGAVMKGAKGTVKGADTVLSAALKKADAARGIEYLQPAAKSAANLGKTIDGKTITDIAEDLVKKNNLGVDNVEALTAAMTKKASSPGLFESYVDLKDKFNKSFNYRANIPDDVIKGVRKADADEIRAAQELSVVQKALTKEIDNYAEKLADVNGLRGAEDFNAIRKAIDKNLVDFHEYRHLDRTSELKDVLQDAYRGRLSVKAASNDNIIQKIQALADDLPVSDYGLELTVDTSGKYVKLSDDWKYFIDPSNKKISELAGKIGGEAAQHVSEMSMDPAKLFEKVKRGASYSDETLKTFKALDYMYETDPDFKKLVDLEESVYNVSNEILNNRFDTHLKTGKNAITDADLDKLNKIYSGKGVSKTSKINDIFNKVSASDLKNKDEILDLLKKFTDNGYGNLDLKGALKRAEEFAGDNMGYVRHAFIKESLDALNKNESVLRDLDTIVTIGNTKVAKDRKYAMSILEANELVVDHLKMNFDGFNSHQKEVAKTIIENGGIFKDSAIASFNDYLANYPKLAKDSKVLDEVLVKSTFFDAEKIKRLNNEIKSAKKAGDMNLAKKLEIEKLNAIDSRAVKYLSNPNDVVPYNYTVLNKTESDKIAGKFKSLADKLGLEDLNGVATYIKNNSSRIAINKDVLRLVDINTNKKTLNGFTRLYDAMLNFFKRNKTLSPTFQLNNFSGNTTNMFLSGMSATDIATTYPEAVEVMVKHKDIYAKKLNGVKLSAREQEILDIWDAFTDAGFGNVKSRTSTQLADMPESLRKYFFEDKTPANAKEFFVDGLPYFNLKLNELGDTAARLATFIHGSNNPIYLNRLGVKDAGEAVRKVLFDASELTTFEKDIVKRVVPFYTFTKKNLAFQLDNIGRHGKQYNQLIKLYNGAWRNVSEDDEINVDEWLRDNFYLPVPSLSKDGSYTVIKTTLPVGELLDFLDNPASKITSSVAPILKMPAELAINKNTFTGADIEKYPGQLSTNIPFLTKKQEYMLGGLTGLDVPIKGIVNAYNGVADTLNSGGNIIESIGRGALNTIKMDRNANTDKLNAMYDELDKLEQLISKYKDKGYDFSNENELIKANDNPTLKKIDAMIDRINGAK